ncbi:AAA family ATPase [Achromobacter sp. Root83]|uniref:AAA family ATPase n=1 Tax=Achromobacter sp. Root83 TaxID=1736602 RepID=UPI000A41AEE2|nr:AAA family ATPase [Achromobacter sp. Root83]
MKIKKVIIEGFRAYETKSDGTFDFTTPSGDPAQFISIYAPNGFGKTSFYDAVEWALTNNIERFVRDYTRVENDNISRAQNQESRRQHILRNRVIPDSAPSRVTVTGIGFGDVIKDVPKARAGSRDYLFKREAPVHGMEEVAGIFLSQEAIDGFLREEKPDARYDRFMQNFGDSDDTYRANLVALRRELTILLKGMSEEQRRYEEVLAKQTDTGIFESVNRTIQSLVDRGERIESISQSFDADSERDLRNLITQRLHELNNSSADFERFLIDLQAALVELPVIAESMATRATAIKALSELEKRRHALNRYTKLKEKVAHSTEFVERAHADTIRHQTLLSKVPLFEETLGQIAQITAREQESEAQLQVKKAELESWEERIATCKTSLQDLDVNANALVALREQAPEIFRDLNEGRAVIAERQAQRDDRQQRLNVLTAKRDLERSNLESLIGLEITEESINAVELTMILEEGISVLPLQQAVLEKARRAELLVAARKALAAFDEQKGQFATLVSLGCEILAKTPSNQCPLCTKEHASPDELLQNILGNQLLNQLEAAALHKQNDAQAAFDESCLHVTALIEEWNQRKDKAVLDFRAGVSQSERELQALTLEIKSLDRDIQAAASRAQTSAQLVLNLSAEQLGQKLAKDIRDVSERRSTEQSDLSRSEDEAQLRRDAVKLLIQAIGEARAKAEQAKGGEVYKELMAVCLSNAVDPAQLRQHVAQMLGDSQAKAAAALQQLKDARDQLEKEEATAPNPSTDDLAFLEREEQSNQRSRLESEAEISTFVSKIGSHLPKYDLSWLPERIVDGINSANAMYAQQKETTTALARQYALLGEQLELVLPYVESIEARKQLDKLLTEKARHEALSAKVNGEYTHVIQRLDSRISSFFFTDLINSIYRKIDPHPDFKEVRFTCEFPEGEKPRLHVLVSDEAGDCIAPNLYFSAAQVNILSLSIFLARALHVKAHGEPVGCIFIDDPIHSMDSINVLATIDLLRTISRKFDRQIILSTHDRNFFELLKRKIPEYHYESKFLELETFGRIKARTGEAQSS